MNNSNTFDLHRGTLLQAYLTAFDHHGLTGLVDRRQTLRWMGFGGVVTQPVTAYDRASQDGPYSPLDHNVVDEGLGGEDTLRSVNAALAADGLAAFGDFVPNHLDARSALVQSTLRAGAVDNSWFRVSRDPSVVSTWANKTNIFGLANTLYEPELDAHRASTFYPDQWELDVTNPEVIAHLQSAAARMVEEWGYAGLRLDAIAYAAGKALSTMGGEHEPAAFELTRRLRRHLRERAAGGREPLLIAEAGGQMGDIARWIDDGVAHAAYDFTWMPTLVHSLDVGDWTPLRRYWGALPQTAGRWLRFLGSHDERQLRYVPFKEALIERHGGRDGEFVCFGGNGLTLPVRNLVPSEAAFVMLLGLTVLSDGLPLVYQTDMGGWRGDPAAKAKDVRDPNRCLVPWIGRADAGWPRNAAYPLDPEWRRRSAMAQMTDRESVMARLAQLIHLRSTHPAFDATPQRRVKSSSPRVEAFARVGGAAAKIVVVGNASHEWAAADLDLRAWPGARVRKLVRVDPVATWLGWSEQKFIGASGRHEVRVAPHGFEVLELLPEGVEA